MMSKKLAGALVGGALACAQLSVAGAQGAGDKPDAADTLQEVVVTGSRLQSAGFNAPTPVTVVTAETVEQRAPANISEVILEQPAFRISGGDSSRSTSGGANANPSVASSIVSPDLRSLGGTRTLVLINSHRTTYSTGTNAVDINTIPVGLVERIDVVTGGASAQYGSDAVAGVTNVILRNRLQGIKANAQLGLTEYAAGKQYTYNLAAGTSFLDDRLHVIGGVDVNRTDAIKDLSGKKFFQDEIGSVGYSAAYRAANNLPATVITTGVEPASVALGGLVVCTTANPANCQASANGTSYTFNASGTPVVFSRGIVSQNGQQMVGSTSNLGHNLNNVAALRAPQARYDFMGRGSFDVTPSVETYVEIGKSRSLYFPYLSSEFQQSASIGGVTPGIVIGPNNVFRNAAINSALGTGQFTMGRINNELSFQGIGGSAARAETEVQRVVVGADGRFGNSWKWDAYYQTGRTYALLQRDDYSAIALQKAVNNCATPTTTANQLGSPGFAANNSVILAARYEQLSGKTCSPFNPFGLGSPSQAALDYIQNATFTNQHIYLDVGAVSLAGSPFKLPAGDLAIATGLEWRQDRLKTVVDPVSAAGNSLEGGLLTNNGVANNGRTSVREGFVELGIPLLKDRPLVRSLDFNAAGRATEYETAGPARTWKLGLTWDILDSLRARITKSHDMRAASLMNMYGFGGPQNATVDTTLLKVGTVGKNGTIYSPLGNVNAAGLAASNAGTAVSTSNTVGGIGNPKLKPESGDTVTGGLVFKIGGFNASADYYYINLTGAIGTPALATVMANCVAGDQYYCAEITFDPTLASGIQLVSALNENLNRQVIKGTDFEVGYRTRLGPGNFQVRGLVNYQPHNESVNFTTGQTTDQANTLGSQPKLAYNLSFGYDVGRWTTDLQVRGFGERRGNNIVYNADGSIAATTVLGPEDGAAYAARVASALAVPGGGAAGTVAASTATTSKNRWPGQYFLNTSVQYKVSDHISGFLNIDNLLDKQPPALATSAAVYDFIGRRYRIGVRANF